MWRAAEWSGALALANPSGMRVGSKTVMFLSSFFNSGFTIIVLAVAITVVVTDMVAPNTLHPISACLCRIARKITLC